MIHKEFFGMLFLAFVAWVFIAGTPSKRIDNFCQPIGWGGNAVTSVSALALPSQQENVKHWFDNFQYGCRYLTWRLFYQDDYNKWKATAGAAQTPAAGTPATGASATPVAGTANAPVAPPAQPVAPAAAPKAAK